MSKYVSRQQKIHGTLIEYVRSRYTMIDVKPEQGLFNKMCHSNCVEYTRLNEDFGVAEVIYIDNNTPILHYLNTKEGIFYETTLGWKAKNLEYYKIRDVHPSDYDNILDEFSRSLSSWLYQFTTKIDRFLFSIKRVL